MRVLLFLAFISAISCNQNEKNDVPHDNKFEIKLIDGLGIVSMEFPQRTDTFFSWIHRNDCGKPCEQGKYRFQSKANKIFKESGWYWTGEPIDSVEQLTIYHQRVDTIVKRNDSLLIKKRVFITNKYFSDVELGDMISDTLMNINNRYFLVFKIADIKKWNLVRQRSLLAITSVNGVLVEFHYKLLRNNYDSVLTQFYDRSINNLKTVVIKDGGG